jgi:hypothetical protein
MTEIAVVLLFDLMNVQGPANQPDIPQERQLTASQQLREQQFTPSAPVAAMTVTPEELNATANSHRVM